MRIKKILRCLLPRTSLSRMEEKLRVMYEKKALRSIRKALIEQDLLSLYNRLCAIVPDIRHQYSSFNIENEYYNTKVRGLHAFQISLVNDALILLKDELANKSPITIVDVGDSAGTHSQYIRSIFQGQNIRCLSVNLDERAVKKIKDKGMEAVCMRAEELTAASIDADIFFSFQMLEHLMDPFKFLKRLSEKTNCKAFVVTVPYLAQSRVGLHHIRLAQNRGVNAENTHIFELSPSDWKLIFRHCGWAVLAERLYLQYPKRSLAATRLNEFWKRYDYEGFYGAVLVKDNRWSILYESWD